MVKKDEQSAADEGQQDPNAQPDREQDTQAAGDDERRSERYRNEGP